MSPRRQYASGFYSRASKAWIEKALHGFEPPKLENPLIAGVVPHAGWDYSGAVAAKVFYTIKSYQEPESFVLFGTVHHQIPNNAIYSRGSWSTPFGDILIDETLAKAIVEKAAGLAGPNASAHENEHSIEVQMPFIKHYFPKSRVVPISVLPDQRAHLLGQRVAEVIKENPGKAVIIGTTDLTHYGDAYFFSCAGYGRGAHEWMKRNDARIIKLAEKLREDELVTEAEKSRNACGAGALAATVGAAKALGSKAGRVIAYTTSFDVAPEREFRMGVGYVGMIFCA
jgi:hypothetical protein